MRRGSVAVVFRGEPEASLSPRLEPMAEALASVDLRVVPVPFADGREPGLEKRLAGLEAVLVWVDPLGDDGDRAGLDEVLRATESAGVWVGARPDVIDRLGTKEVLVTTRDLGWGSDAHVYRSSEEFRREFPRRLAVHGVRVLKADRGNGGRTVWKVRLHGGPATTAPGPAAEVVVQHARVRDGAATTMSVASLTRLVDDARVFEGWGGTGCLVDQEFVPGITRGIVRCYLVGGDVVGFARQYPAGAVPEGPLGVVPETLPAPDEVMGLPSPKTMYPPDEPAFSSLCEHLETDWVPGLAHVVGLRPEDLPALWDVDLLIADGPTDSDDAPRFVLCEINASSIIPFPPLAPARMAAHVRDALARH